MEKRHEYETITADRSLGRAIRPLPLPQKVNSIRLDSEGWAALLSTKDGKGSWKLLTG